MLVRDILNSKGSAVYSIEPDATVYQAIAKMDDLDVGALVVTKGDSLKGIISERDYRSKVILKGRSSKDTKVSEIMSSDVQCVSPETSVGQCMSLMTNQKIRHLPVLNDNNLKGVVSIGDLVKSIISNQKEEIKDLRHYIQGDGNYPG